MALKKKGEFLVADVSSESVTKLAILHSNGRREADHSSTLKGGNQEEKDLLQGGHYLPN